MSGGVERRWAESALDYEKVACLKSDVSLVVLHCSFGSSELSKTALDLRMPRLAYKWVSGKSEHRRTAVLVEC